MYNNRKAEHITIIHWVVFWGIIAIMAQSTLSIVGSWAAIVAGGLAIIGVVCGICRHFRRKLALRQLFDLYCLIGEEKSYSFSSVVSPEPQFIQLVLEVKADLNAMFMHFSFRGSGVKPDMNFIYDWQFGIEDINPDFRVKQVSDGSWNWTYTKQFPKRRQSKIRVGIKYTAANSFKGDLEVHLTCEEAKRSILLPFEVKEGSA